MRLRSCFMAIAGMLTLAAPTTFAGTREFEPQPLRFERTQKTQGYEDVQLKADVYNVWFETVKEERTYWQYDCDTDTGDGTGGNWHNYWNVKKSEKPGALADSIKGIGLSSAKKIVESNKYFLKKPRSWNAFKEEIRAISRDSSLDLGDVYYNVIISFGKENAENLGYASSTNCEWKQVTELVDVIKKQRSLIKTISTKVNIGFEGGLLLSTEKEIFEATYDGVDTIIRAVSTVNEYQLQTQDGSNNYLLRAIKRYAVTPEVSQIRASIVKANGTLILKLSDRLKDELSSLYPDQALEVHYKVTRKAFINNNEAEGTVAISDGKAEIDLKTDPVWEKAGLFSSAKKTLRSGQTYFVQLQIKRMNTDVFNGSSSSWASTNEVTY